MRRLTGFSITETMVTLGIVSIVGLGFYSGFTQLDDAVSQQRATSKATTSQALLLSLLETDLANHGLGITDPSPACFIAYDSSNASFVSSCDEDLVPIPAPGIVTCRSNPESNDVLMTMVYRVTASDLALATGQSEDEVIASTKNTVNPLDWVIRDTWTQASCEDYPSAAGLKDYLNTNFGFASLGEAGLKSRIVEVNAQELSFKPEGANVSVAFIPKVDRVLQNVGNSTQVAEIPVNQTSELQSVSLLDGVADLPIVSFPYGVYLVRPSSASSPADIPIEIPVPIFRERTGNEALNVRFLLEEKLSDGTWQTLSQPNDTYRIEAGQQPSQQNVALNVGRRITLYSSKNYILGEHSQAVALSTEDTDEQNHKLTVRMLWPSRGIQRADGAMTVGSVLMNRPLDASADPITINLNVSGGGKCGGTSNSIDGTLSVADDASYMLAVSPGQLPSASASTPTAFIRTCADTDISGSDSGEFTLPLSMNSASSALNSLELTILVNASGAEKTLDLALQPNVGVQFEGPTHQSIDIVNEDLLPEVNFVQTQSTAIEPVSGEQRGTQLTVFFDPPTENALTLVLDDTTDDNQLECHPINGNYYFVNASGTALVHQDGTWTDPVSTGEFDTNPSTNSGGCLDVGTGETSLRPISVPAGTEQLSIPIRLLPSSETENGFTIDLAIAPQPASYTIGNRNTAQVHIEEYGRVNFTAASATFDEDIIETDWPNESPPIFRRSINLAVDPTSDSTVTAYVSMYGGDPTDSNSLSANIPGDIRIPATQQSITIPANASSAQVIFDIDNDLEFDRGKRFYATIDRVVGGAIPGLTPNALTGMPAHSILGEILDQDLCAIGAGLTSGQSPLNHFHSRGNSLLDDAEIDGATIRIESGYDSANDRLILDGYDGVESGNSVTYDSLDYAHVVRGLNDLFVPINEVLSDDLVQGNYEIDALFTVEQGVLELEIESNPDGESTILAPLMVKFMRDIVNYRNVGTGSGNRSVTFTLGSDVQAWDGHEDGTTHYYKFVPFESGNALSWTTSRDEAKSEANQFFGNTGYLATITSEAENQFIQTRFNLGGGNPNGWAGGASKVTGAGENSDWYWTEGPEGQESGGLGRWWWRGGNGSNGKAENWVRTDNTEGLSNANCSNVGPDGQQMTGVQRLLFGYSETTDSNGDVIPDSTRRYAMWRCQGNGNRQEPNGAFNEARGLKIIGGLASNQTWNDERQSFTNYQYSKGYYVEYGGPEKSDFGIRNLKLSQTSTFSATSCGVDHGTQSQMCRAWSDLNAAQTASPGQADFYSPGTLGAGAEVFGETRGSAHIYIDHQNYNQSNDRLTLANSIGTSGGVSVTNYAPVSIMSDASGSDQTFSLSATYYANQGYLRVTATPAATGQQWADLLNRTVEYQNQGGVSASDYGIERSITYTLGDGIAWPYHPDGTVHIYRYVDDGDRNWTSSRSVASATDTNYFNETGYLATVTSEAEHEFLARNIVRPDGSPFIAWLGGTDEDTEGEWIWKDGPEAGVQFWSSYLTNGKPIMAGNGQIDSSFDLPTCQQQNETRDGSIHNSGTDVHVLDMLQGTTAEASPHRFTKWSCAPNNPDLRPEPSGEPSGDQEDYLILSATARGGETWNDTLLAGSSGNDWLNPTGYLQEFGGDNEFFNRSTTQTFRVAPEQCVLMRNDSIGGCLPGDGLTIGTNSNTNDFYGPAPNGISGSMTSRANVRISLATYVNQNLTIRDELALRGTTGLLSDNQLERTYTNVPVTFSGVASGTTVNGTWNFSTGVMRLTSVNSSNNPVNIPAAAWVDFFNQRIQLVYAPEADGTDGDREIEFTLGDALAWDGHEDGTTHFYRFVAFPSGTANSDKEWTDSRTAAMSTAQQYFGVTGYLATITSLQENQLMASGFSDNEGNPAAGWVGGSDQDSEGDWIWMDGPEANLRFHAGQDTSIKDNPNNASDLDGWGDQTTSTNCSAQNNTWHLTNFSSTNPLYTAADQSDRILYWRNFGFPSDASANSNGKRFSNWSCNGGSGGRQPSNSGSGGQDYLLITGSSRGGGMWNDVGNEGIPGSGDLYTTTGYYVEYGGSGEFNNRKFNATVTLDSQCEVQ